MLQALFPALGGYHDLFESHCRCGVSCALGSPNVIAIGDCAAGALLRERWQRPQQGAERRYQNPETNVSTHDPPNSGCIPRL
jgi:hypothetical protein